MGKLRNPESWGEPLKDIFPAFEQCIAGQGMALTHRRWFTAGRSEDPVASAIRELETERGGDHLALKFFRSGGELKIERLKEAWALSTGFQQHLGETVGWSLIFGQWRAVFMRIAGGDIGDVEALSQLVDRPELPDYCESIVRSVVGDWNPGNPGHAAGTVGALVHEVLAHREDQTIAWAREAGIPVDGSAAPVDRGEWSTRVNPFALLKGAPSTASLEAVLVGRTHGDLSGRNILLPQGMTVRPDEFVLIDYDRFRHNGPLARDPMHLLVALVLDQIGQEDLRVSPRLAQALVHPEDVSRSSFNEVQRRLAIKIRDAPDLRTSGYRADWRQQCLLFLAATALLHLGRKLHVPDERRTKEWCFHLAALAAEQFLFTVPEPAGGWNAAHGVGRSSEGEGRLIGRAADSQRVRSLLTDGQPGVAVVSGKPGVGKTSLLDEVVGALSSGPSGVAPDVRITRHEARVGVGLDAHTLINYIEGKPSRARRGGSAFVQLLGALRRLGETQVVLVVDAAENLLVPETRTLADAELDHALDLLVNDPEHRVKVVLVSQHPLASANDDSMWPENDHMVLSKLDAHDYRAFLVSLGQDGRWDVPSLSPSAYRSLYTRLQGNPRLGELARAVVLLDAAGPTLEVLEGLLSKDRGNVGASLIRRLVRRLDPDQLAVMEALAVFDIPVPETTVTDFLDADPATVGKALSELVDARVVQQAEPGRYLLRPLERNLIEVALPATATRPDRYVRAAGHLTRLKMNHPGEFAMLRESFAELRALINGEQWADAGKKIEELDDVLIEWNCRHQLLEQRRKVVGKLGAEDAEMRNHNVLGQIYATNGSYAKAHEEYDIALTLAEDAADLAVLSVRGNLATLHQQQNEVFLAQGQYERIRDLARAYERDADLMQALAGIADCRRRNGDYDGAVANARAAFAQSRAPALAEGRKASRATSSRVNLALKLARWFGELGQPSDAEEWLLVARNEAMDLGEQLVHASWLDGQAVAFLERGDLKAARADAVSAVELATMQGDDVIVLQARTTLAFIGVMSGEFDEAWREARAALAVRKPRRSLVVLALAALAAERIGESSRARTLFDELRDDAAKRLAVNSEDFTAADMQAYAICGKHVISGADLGAAIKALRKSRQILVRPPKLTARLRVMVEELGIGEDELREVLEAL
ncbi:AAA family ATPase [Lentzea sp. NPDC058436]|uniref:AAA family ATPase n=1 Tax=Lentzea sp. NPDC058436 TaxID=3346499 RepID=UPI00364B822D